jgi:hypothetical protein
MALDSNPAALSHDEVEERASELLNPSCTVVSEDET